MIYFKVVAEIMLLHEVRNGNSVADGWMASPVTDE